MRKLKVAFFIDTWNPGSGTENQLKGMLDNFDSDQVEAVLYTLRHEIPEALRSGFRCSVRCLGVGRLVSSGAVRRFPGLVRQLRTERFDLAMVYFLDTNFYVVPACRLAGIPAVIVNRRDMGYWYEPGILRRLNFVNTLTDYFLVNSRAVKSQVVRHEGFPAERVHVLLNGMWDRATDSSEGELEASAPSYSIGAPTVGITASLRPVKRIDRFIEMAALVADRVSDCRFLIAGRGELQGELESLVAERGLDDRIRFLGQVADVPALLAALDVAVLTSESEGLSNSLMEYALAGVPAVAFDTGGNCEVVREGETGFLVPEGDVESMAERVVRLLTDDKLRREQAAAGQRFCQAAFSPQQIMQQTLDLFTGIVDSPRRGYHAQGGEA